jgi:hypothetical protein
VKYAWFVVTLLAARFIVTAIEYPPIDGDLAWQRWLGNTILATHRIPHALGPETYTAVGAPWTPQEWFFSIVAALSVSSIAWTLFALGTAACALAAILLVAYRAVRRGATPTNVAIVAALTGTAMVDTFAVRAQIVAWPILALMLLVLDTEGPWLWACVPIAAIWSNLHASAMLAPLLVGATAFGRLLEDRAWTPRVRRAVIVTFAVAAAICCNPLGIGLPLYAASLFASPITAYINEWRPTDIGFYAFSLGSLPVLLAAVILGTVRRGEKTAKIEDILIFTAFTFLLFLASRNIAVFAIAAAPIIACSLGDAFPESRKFSDVRIPPFVLPVFVVLLAVVIGLKIHTSTERTISAIPKKEIRALANMPGEHRVFCSNFAWSSYFFGNSTVRVFLDGRSDPYPFRVWKDFAIISFLRPRWRDVLASYHVDSVIDDRDAPIDQAIALTNDWRDALHDEKFRLWIRK